MTFFNGRYLLSAAVRKEGCVKKIIVNNQWSIVNYSFYFLKLNPLEHLFNYEIYNYKNFITIYTYNT